jgi:2-keto-4-pentenoate hydratase
MKPDTAARLLLDARRSGTGISFTQVLPADRAGAYAVQEATLAGVGPVGGWKVGAKNLEAEPTFAPLPAAGLLRSGAQLAGPAWRMRGVELEVGFRLARDIDAGDRLLSRDELAAAMDCVLPVIEVVETRLADWRDSDPLAQLADLGTHGALVLGDASALQPAQVDLRTVDAYLAFDGQPVAVTRGANPAGDVWRLLAHLALHASRRGRPVRAGQVVTTGSCTGMLFAPEGAKVQGQLTGIGGVDLQF